MNFKQIHEQQQSAANNYAKGLNNIKTCTDAAFMTFEKAIGKESIFRSDYDKEKEIRDANRGRIGKYECELWYLVEPKEEVKFTALKTLTIKDVNK